MTRGIQTREPVAQTESILIVEDNPDGRETLRRLLELEGHQVNVAADGAEGVQVAIAEHPATAVVDIGLPRLDGYEVAQRLREAFGRRLVLIAYTAYGLREDRERAARAGFDAFYVKPGDLEKLLERLRSLPPLASPHQ